MSHQRMELRSRASLRRSRLLQVVELLLQGMLRKLIVVLGRTIGGESEDVLAIAEEPRSNMMSSEG